MNKTELTPSPKHARFFISYRRSGKNDAALAKFLNDQLLAAGHDVFIDINIPVGTEWAKEISARIAWCDYLVVLLSEDSIKSEAVQSEVRLASQRRREDAGPGILPIRVEYKGPLGYELEVHLGHFQDLMWQSPDDNVIVFNELNKRVQNASIKSSSLTSDAGVVKEKTLTTGTKDWPQAVADPRILSMPPGGTIRLNDPLYLTRHADQRVLLEAKTMGETIVIKAPRQMGKSSLLIRYLAACRDAGKRFAYIDFQRFPDDVLKQYDRFLHSLATQLVSRLQLDVQVPTFSTEACQLEFDQFVTKKLLGSIDGPTTFAFDEVDRILGCSYQGSFFSMLRGWHNARADLSQTWEEVDLALVISTEPYLLIDSGDQSPFNVTPAIELPPFGRESITRLNEQFAQLLCHRELDELYELLNGQPYLIRLAFLRLGSSEYSFSELVDCAAESDGPFGDHLRALLMRLDQSNLRASMQQVTLGYKIDDTTYYRLHGAGLVYRKNHQIQPANLLYARFFREMQ